VTVVVAETAALRVMVETAAHAANPTAMETNRRRLKYTFLFIKQYMNKNIQHSSRNLLVLGQIPE
jgi:hypothetical protein